MSARIVVAIVMGGAASLAAGAELPTAPAPRDASPERLRERFFGIWLEQERVRSGVRTTDPFDLFGWDFGELEWSVWLRRGELSAAGSKRGVRVDATARPMRFDLLDTGMDGGVIKPGIFKFDGDKLVIAVVDRWFAEKPLAKGADHPRRPTEFTSTKTNGVAVYVLYRGKYFYDQD